MAKKNKKCDVVDTYYNNMNQEVCWRGYVVKKGWTVNLLKDGTIVREEDIKRINVVSDDTYITNNQ